MDLDHLEKIFVLMKEHGVTEVELGEGESTTRVRFPEPSLIASQQVVPMQPVSSTSETSTSVTDDSLKQIKSPFVGTYYVAPSPGAEPYVKVGQKVEKGQVLCIVEAMKLMNEIEADCSGILRKAFVENEDPVEFDQPLFGIEPL